MVTTVNETEKKSSQDKLLKIGELAQQADVAVANCKH
jgi:hypothetical protein